MLNCKDVTRLLSEAQDRPLTMKERLPLAMHLMVCKGCANFRKQMEFIRTACRQRAPAEENKFDRSIGKRID